MTLGIASAARIAVVAVACSAALLPVMALAGAGHRADTRGPARAVPRIVGADVLAGCQLRKGAFLKVIAPGQRAATFIPNFSFTACANQSALRVDAVHPGTGIPGFTAS